MGRRLGQFENSSEAHKDAPRINSSYHRAYYDEIVELSRHLDFSKPCFDNHHKRNFSLGSVQAFICELAITEPTIIEKLKKYMKRGGEHYIPPTVAHTDKYWEHDGAVKVVPGSGPKIKVVEVSPGQKFRHNEAKEVYTLRVDKNIWYLEGRDGRWSKGVTEERMMKVLSQHYTLI